MPHRSTRSPVATVAEATRARSRPETNPRRVALLAAGGLLAALLSLAFVFSPAAQDAADAATCDEYASPGGSAQRLVDSLSSGQVGCLRGGTYTDGDGSLMIRRSGVTLTSAPGASATLNARIYVPEGTNRVTVSNLTIRGTHGKTNVLVRGDYTRWLYNDVTNGHRDSRNSSCFLVGTNARTDQATAVGTEIRGNRIHDCGALPRTNHNHGIYVGDSRQAKIVGNRIYGNADRGVQLYPDAQGTLVEGNTIDGNAQGIVFDGSSSNNVVRANVISNPRVSYNVYSPGAAHGSSNLVAGNCLWRNGGSGIDPDPQVFSVRSNVVARPGSSLCLSVL